MLRSAVCGALALLTATFVTASAVAQEKYPSKEIHFISAFSPGSGADIMVRFFADKIGKRQDTSSLWKIGRAEAACSR